MKLINPDFSTAKLKKEREFATASMNATLIRLKAGDSLENLVITPPTQTGSSSGNIPPKSRPTYQGPDDDNNLFRDTEQFVLGMHPQAPSLQRGYSSKSPSQGKDSRPYDCRN